MEEEWLGASSNSSVIIITFSSYNSHFNPDKMQMVNVIVSRNLAEHRGRLKTKFLQLFN
jgi:hypothetical protein